MRWLAPELNPASQHPGIWRLIDRTITQMSINRSMQPPWACWKPARWAKISSTRQGYLHYCQSGSLSQPSQYGGMLEHKPPTERESVSRHPEVQRRCEGLWRQDTWYLYNLGAEGLGRHSGSGRYFCALKTVRLNVEVTAQYGNLPRCSKQCSVDRSAVLTNVSQYESHAAPTNEVCAPTMGGLPEPTNILRKSHPSRTL